MSKITATELTQEAMGALLNVMRNGDPRAALDAARYILDPSGGIGEMFVRESREAEAALRDKREAEFSDGIPKSAVRFCVPHSEWNPKKPRPAWADEIMEVLTDGGDPAGMIIRCGDGFFRVLKARDNERTRCLDGWADPSGPEPAAETAPPRHPET